eukprot:GHVQ01006414.1.p1 GENE.GHVQ01006414.1~~GHVQ01006414.1.p1  ORF type:complete len:898 (+),score=153.99 GHVQ01006414.1:139-2832(+)
MESELTQLLLRCSDPGTCHAAEAALKQAEDHSLASYLELLARELNDELKPLHVRQLAGLMLKNAICGKDKKVDHERSERWKALPEEVTDVVKQKALDTLKDNAGEVRGAAAQVVSKLGRIELPRNRWPQIFPFLLQLASAESALFRKSSQTAISYLCEDLYECMEDEAEPLNEENCNNVLTTTVKGMSDLDSPVKLAATKAFYYALYFARESFKKEDERNLILETVCNNCRHSDTDIQAAAFECIVQLAAEFYNYLHQYMNVIGPMTWEAISQGADAVAIPALEFWNQICDEEIFLSHTPSRENHHFIKVAMPYLLPILLEALTKQGDEDDDMDNWTLSMAAGTCLSLCSQVLQNNILQVVLNFVTTNFGDADWRRREAAVMAYGSIMEGPDSDKLKPLVQQSFQNLCGVLNDPSVCVRDTAAWTIGRIASFHTSIIIPLLGRPASGEAAVGAAVVEGGELVQLLLTKLTDKPRVAANVCWVISEVADNMGKWWGGGRCGVGGGGGGGVDVNGDVGGTESPLDCWFSHLCETLAQVAQRPDADERQLREAACNALNSVVEAVSDRCKTQMERVMEHFLQLLEVSLVVCPVSEVTLTLQSSYCICLQALFRRLDSHIVPHADKIWSMLAKMLLNSPGNNPPEEGLLTVASWLRAIKGRVEPHMEQLNQVLLLGLSNVEYVETFNLSTELVGDVSRILGKKFIPFSEAVLSRLYEALKNPTADKSIKPRIFIAIGDVAMSIGGEWEKFLNPFMEILQLAASSAKPEDDDSDEYTKWVSEMRDSMLQAHSGMVYGMKEGGKLDIMKIHVNTMLELVQLVVDTDKRFLGEHNLCNAIALTGDLVNAYGAELMQHLKALPFLQRLLERASELDQIDEQSMLETQRNAKWLNEVCVSVNVGES